MSKWDWTRSASARAAGVQAMPEPRKRIKRRAERHAASETTDVRVYVFGRERHICRCCRKRPAQSMHEITPRGHGGVPSKRNSVAVCGQLVGTDDGCHTWLQLEEIDVEYGPRGAEETLAFTPTTTRAAAHMGLALGETLESPILQTTEIAPL